MEYLQYIARIYIAVKEDKVLNLVISGIPSIPNGILTINDVEIRKSFKPCYKWNTFNTIKMWGNMNEEMVF